jgi:hypothetical protein
MRFLGGKLKAALIKGELRKNDAEVAALHVVQSPPPKQAD